MRLLLITNEFPPIGGGGSSVLQYAARYLTEEHGHEVTIITSHFRGLPRREYLGRARIIRVPAVRRYQDYCAVWELILFGLSALFYGVWLVPRYKPDLIQAYFALPGGFVARVLRLLYGTPYVLYFGGSDMPGANPSRYKRLYPFIGGLTRWVWRGAAVSTVCSEGLLTLGRQLDPRYDFRLVPNGVELVRFVPVERPANPVVKVLFIGRLIPRKGFQYVVRSLPRVREQTSLPFEIEVVGSGAMRASLDDLAVRLGVSHLLKYVGTIPYGELHRVYQAADIFVLTSESEGMPCAILEAMACSLPIITTNVSGNHEIVHDGMNGFLISVGDTEGLARALSTLIRDPSHRRRMGRESRRLVQAYDWHDIVRRYEALFREVVEMRAAGPDSQNAPAVAHPSLGSQVAEPASVAAAQGAVRGSSRQ